MSPATDPIQTSREIRDPRALRAVAHPLRITLLELIGREGQLTATGASELSGESVASCSFHLRQLAKYGFIEAVRGEGREKPWRLVTSSHSWSAVDDSSERAVAGRLLTSVLADREFAQFEDWLDERATESTEWQDAALIQQSLLYLSAQELADLSNQINELIAPYFNRPDVAERPENARPVRFFAVGYPIKPTERGN